MNFMVWRGAVVRANSEAGDYHPKLRGDDTTQPFSAVLVKALDCGLDDYPQWQGNFDAGAPHSADELDDQLTGYRMQGIDAIPWGVSRGTHARDEGIMAGNAAGRDPQGRFCLDLEPYDMFWTGSTPERVRAWLQGFKDGGGRELWISTDSRNTKPREVDLPTWLADSIVTRVMPQAYWTDFEQDWKTGIDVSYLPLMELGVPLMMIHPTLPLNATAGDLQDAIGYCMSQPAFGGVNFWRRGIATQQLIDLMATWPQPVFEALSDKPAPDPVPLPLPPTIPADEAWRAAYAQSLRDTIQLLQDRLNAL